MANNAKATISRWPSLGSMTHALMIGRGTSAARAHKESGKSKQTQAAEAEATAASAAAEEREPNKDAEQAKKKKKKRKNKKEQAGGAAAKGNVGVGDSAAGPLKSAAATKGGAGGGQCSATDFMVWLTAVQWELENDGDTDERVVDAHVAALSAFGAEMEGVCRAAVFHLDEASGACELDPQFFATPGDDDNKGRLDQLEAGLVEYARENNGGLWHSCIRDVTLRVERLGSRMVLGDKSIKNLAEFASFWSNTKRATSWLSDEARRLDAALRNEARQRQEVMRPRLRLGSMRRDVQPSTCCPKPTKKPARNQAGQ